MLLLGFVAYCSSYGSRVMVEFVISVIGRICSVLKLTENQVWGQDTLLMLLLGFAVY